MENTFYKDHLVVNIQTYFKQYLKFNFLVIQISTGWIQIRNVQHMILLLLLLIMAMLEVDVLKKILGFSILPVL